MLGDCRPAIANLPPTVKDEIQVMFVRLSLSQMVVDKLVKDQKTDCPMTLSSLSDDKTTAICDVIRRSGDLVNKRTPARGNQVSALAAKNLQLTTFMLKMTAFSKPYDVYPANSRGVLEYQHQ